MRIKKMIIKGELRPVLKQFLPTSTARYKSKYKMVGVLPIRIV